MAWEERVRTHYDAAKKRHSVILEGYELRPRLIGYIFKNNGAYAFGPLTAEFRPQYGMTLREVRGLIAKPLGITNY